MRITLTSVLVDEQERALDFYTNILASERRPTSQPVRIDGSQSSHPMIPTVSSFSWSPTSTQRPRSSRLRSSRTASRTSRSPSTTSSANTTGYASSAFGSRKSRRRWARS